MENSKKILFTTENTSWGGSELLWTRTVVELLPCGFSIAVCVHAKLILPKEILLLGKENKLIINYFSKAALPLWKRMANRFLSDNKRFKPVNERDTFILNFKPHLIVINQGFNFNGVQTMGFAVQNKFKYVTISHAVNEGMWPNLVLRKKMKLGFENSQMNYFVSEDNLTITQNQLGFALNNAEVIRNPFNVPLNPKLDFPEQNDFHLAFVGRYDFYAKGQDVLIRVLALEKWKNRNLVVNFYGEGNDIENIKDLIHLYEIKNAIVHSHTNTLDIWKNNKGLILTSRFEGLPIVIVEAMLCKRLVIVTDVSGNKELVLDNETGFIAAAPRPEYVDEALERAWQVRENWQQIGEEARIQILKHIPENPAMIFANQLQSVLNNI
ncbi:glycosyltransferase family 4 protein [Flavobacterium sp.]|uniref:glycosyltransferase family 4 protein n=1 Tax=Flavobacterium sp. TaxID=239 RepID=UPI00374FFF41